MGRRRVTDAESRRASRRWWDGDADAYQDEHGDFLGDVDFVWCPEGAREADARLLGDVARPACPRAGVRRRRRAPAGCASPGAEVVALDLSAGMLRHARAAADRSGVRVPLVQADALALPFADGAFDIVCTAFGAVPFVADSAAVMREVARVLRPGGPGCSPSPTRCGGSSWTTPDRTGLVAVTRTSTAARTSSRTPTASSPTSSSTAPWATGCASWSPPVSCCVDLVEPEWPEGHDAIWGQWSPLRGRLFPGTAIFVADRH